MQNTIDVYDPVLSEVPEVPFEDLVVMTGAWLDLAVSRDMSSIEGSLAARAYSNCQTLLNELCRLRKAQGLSTEVNAFAIRAAGVRYAQAQNNEVA